MDKGRDDRRTSRRISFVPVNVNNTKDVLRDSSVIEREREELYFFYWIILLVENKEEKEKNEWVKINFHFLK